MPLKTDLSVLATAAFLADTEYPLRKTFLSQRFENLSNPPVEETPQSRLKSPYAVLLRSSRWSKSPRPSPIQSS